MLAAIDVGSNTVRMLMGRMVADRLQPVHYFRRITRLGGDFNPQKGLAPGSMERTLFALEEFARELEQTRPTALRVVGTAALRRAANRQEFVERLHQATGFTMEIISGQEEAELTAAGVLEALEPQPVRALVVDIGGGSTEFALLEKGRVRQSASIPLGAVRLCEETPDEGTRQRLIEQLLDRLSVELTELKGKTGWELVGTAGTVTTLAALQLEMADYDWRRVNNFSFSNSELRWQYQRLLPMSVPQREQLAGMEAGRGDLILPGIEILQALLTRLNLQQVRVSDFGLLEGLILSLRQDASD